MKPFRLKFNSESEIELASVNDRTIALIIDFSIFNVVYFILVSFWKSSFSNTIIIQHLYIPAFIAFKVFIESFTGTTIGKRYLNLTVIDNLHNPASFKFIIKRHLVYLIFALISITLSLLFMIESTSTFMREHFSTTTLKLIGLAISKYTINLLVFIDLVSISKDPQDQHRSLHDRMGNTLVIKVKSPAK